MKQIIFILSLLFMARPLYASLNSQLPTSKEDFCKRSNPNGPTINVKLFSSNEKNLMDFKNDGGLFNGGVCWWHSRFQRNAMYLTIFRPNEKYKSLNEVRETIQNIRKGTKIITVKEFSNFKDFTKTYQKEIQSVLDDWQIYDGVFLGMWINGLKGNTTIEPHKLEQMMNHLYQYVEIEGRIAYQKLQIKGITAHAWLIAGMKKTDGGYEIGFIDSNWPNMLINYSYKYGDRSFNMKAYGDFVPYLEFTREEDRLQQVASSFCKSGFATGTQNEAILKQWEDEYWQDVTEARAYLEDSESI